jgi:hypothetical protein
MSATRETGIVTIAAIRKQSGKKPTQYLFNERQAIFTISVSGKAGRDFAARLREAFRKKLPVKVQLNSKEGSIQRIELPSARESKEFSRLRSEACGWKFRPLIRRSST